MDINLPQDIEWPEIVKQSKILNMKKSQFKQGTASSNFNPMQTHERMLKEKYLHQAGDPRQTPPSP